MKLSEYITEIHKFGHKEMLFHLFFSFTRSARWYGRMMSERDRKYQSMNSRELVAELQKQYKDRMGEEIDIVHPRTYNQKIQWMKIYDVSAEKTKLSDKYQVRGWIAEKIGKEYLIPLIEVWEHPSEIDFDALPRSFCLKANHGSGMNYVVKDKTELSVRDIKKIRKMLQGWMEIPYCAYYMEFQYRNISRKILAEKYIEQMSGNLFDYKIHCFNGKPEIIQVIGDRDLEQHTAMEAFFDTDWKRNKQMYNTYDQYEKTPEKPKKLNEMLRIARILSRGFRYVRVDLYNIDGEIKFGEMTFTPAAGYGKWGGGIAIERLVGDMIDLGI